MPKQMSEKTFSNLLDYYIACLEQEDLLSVTFNVSSENTSFLSTLFQTEVLFHTNNKRVIVKNTEGAKKFFQTSLLRQKKTPLFYGYPIIIGPKGTLSPLFFTELQYEQKEDTIILQTTTTNYTLNHHILSQHHFSAEEIKNIQQEIQGEPFLSALQALCEILHFPKTECQPVLDEKQFKHTTKYKLLNKAIVYFGERTDITLNLIKELIQLKKKSLDELASSSLLLLLTGEYQSHKINKNNKTLLEIFSLNIAQKNAIQNSLQDPLTVITGPPGTGKSQVVLNIIANAVYQNKTVLFASKNNKAVDVVIEKLNAILPYRLIVRMGHQTHRRNTKAGLEQLVKQHIPERILDEKTLLNLKNVSNQIDQIQNQIFDLRRLNESIESIQEALDFYEKQHPDDVLIHDQKARLNLIDPLLLQEDLRKLRNKPLFLKQLSSRRYQRKLGQCFNKYYNRIPPLQKTFIQNMITNKRTAKETALQWILAWKKIELAHDEIRTLKRKLLTFPSYIDLKRKQTILQKEYLLLSQTVLQHHWINKFKESQTNEKQEIEIFFSASEQLEVQHGDDQLFRQLHSQRTRSFQRILKYLPVWVVTNLSAKQSFPLKNNIFDLLIIDEASQCDITSALPLFYRAKQVVIIGDPYQLKHISRLTDAQDQALAMAHHVSEEVYTDLSYSKHSLYDFAEKIIHIHGEQPLLLNEHYRCHPDIVTFSNDYYYEQKLTIATDETKLLHHPSFQTRILWHQVKGKTIHSKSPYNEEEAERVIEELLKILEIASFLHASIGVVTLFRAQTEIITEKLRPFKDIFEMDITIGTAHRFQGDEKDIIVFSPAVSEGIKPGTLHWIQTTSQLLNVAVTRARSLFIIIGDQQICRQTTGPLRNLCDYVDRINTQSFLIDSQTRQMLFTEARKKNIVILPQYSIKGNNPYLLDFAYFVNGNRYAIIIQDRSHNLDRKQLQSDGWKIRVFSNKDIQDNLSETIEELKRLC